MKAWQYLNTSWGTIRDHPNFEVSIGYEKPGGRVVMCGSRTGGASCKIRDFLEGDAKGIQGAIMHHLGERILDEVIATVQTILARKSKSIGSLKEEIKWRRELFRENLEKITRNKVYRDELLD
ncbi:MAG: hypothetical protein ACFFCS_03665 [Candidatus Hodarchaeota archaeon]